MSKTITEQEVAETLKQLFYSGKVKPSYNKIVAELEKNNENLDLIFLACQCLVRIKDFDQLLIYANKAITRFSTFTLSQSTSVPSTDTSKSSSTAVPP